MVVDLSIEGDQNLPVSAPEWLISGGKVDNREAHVTEPDASQIGQGDPAPIWPPVRLHLEHTDEVGLVDPTAPLLNDAGNSAHVIPRSYPPSGRPERYRGRWERSRSAFSASS